MSNTSDNNNLLHADEGGNSCQTPWDTREWGSPNSFASLPDVLQEVVRSSVGEAMQEMRDEIVHRLNGLSAALQVLCEAAIRKSEDSSSGGSLHASTSSDRESASGSYDILPLVGSESAEREARATLVRLLNKVNKMTGLRAGEQGFASSSSSSSLMPVTRRTALSPINGHSDLDCPSPIPEDGQVIDPSIEPESVPHPDSAGGLESDQAPTSLLNHMGDEQQAEEFAHKEPEASFPSEKAEDAAKASEPHILSRLSRQDGLPGAVVNQEVQQHAPAENHGNNAAQSSQSLFFNTFERRKTKLGNRMPCSLSEMEEENLLMNIDRLRRRLRSKKSKSSTSRSKVAPHRSKDVGRTANIPGTDVFSDSVTNLQDPRSGERRVLQNYSPCTEDDVGSDGSEQGPESQRLGTAVVPDVARTKAPRSLEQLRSEHAQKIVDDYTGLEDRVILTRVSKWKARVEAWNHAFCSSRLVPALKEVPEHCLVAFGITQQGNGLLSRSYATGMIFIRLGVVSFIVAQHCAKAMESFPIFHASFIYLILALGSLVSKSLIWEGQPARRLGSTSLIGGKHFIWTVFV
eukprot:TRINITY_DN3799_c0_g2_i2.p1 TRINITY_DN3799_c0_g2~~TRINITY_DN3799_c0_g2_i2.p1  ORF type:complete len:575 (+),score=91.49 TRINITY_DN3799_c0_g2_i2:51-1775(+)